MTTYYGLYGQKVQYLASDPTDVQVGQVWYNSTSAVLKVRSATTTNTWASGGNLNTPRYGSASAGTQTATIAFGGNNTGIVSSVENYNGTSWTNGTSLPGTLQYGGSSGTQTAALSTGGYNGSTYNNTVSQKWNGSAWSSGGNLNTGRGALGVGIVGLQTAGLAVAGQSSGGSADNKSESYNGTSWTNTPTLNTNRAFHAAWGSTTGAMAVGAPGGSDGTAVESWNGSSWTTSTSYPTSIGSCAGFGTSYINGVIIEGGVPAGPGKSAACSIWNGSSWTATGSMGTARSNISASGDASNGLCVGGIGTSTPLANTEEYTGTVISTKTVTVT